MILIYASGSRPQIPLWRPKNIWETLYVTIINSPNWLLPSEIEPSGNLSTFIDYSNIMPALRINTWPFVIVIYTGNVSQFFWVELEPVSQSDAIAYDIRITQGHSLTWTYNFLCSISIHNLWKSVIIFREILEGLGRGKKSEKWNPASTRYVRNCESETPSPASSHVGWRDVIP